MSRIIKKKGEFVAQFKSTILILPSGTYRLNQFPLPYVTSEHKIESAELNALLTAPLTRDQPNINQQTTTNDKREKMDTS